MRAFIAINFTNDIIRRLIKAQDELRDYDKYANYSRRENLHLTLAFIGETERIDDIKKIMDACACPPFKLAICGSGRFGDDIFWAGIEKNPALESLAEGLKDALRAAGFPIEKRRFTPHVTLAREIRVADGVHLNIPKTEMTLSSISLMKSERIRGKLTYTEVYKTNLL